MWNVERPLRQPLERNGIPQTPPWLFSILEQVAATHRVPNTCVTRGIVLVQVALNEHIVAGEWPNCGSNPSGYPKHLVLGPALSRRDGLNLSPASQGHHRTFGPGSPSSVNLTATCRRSRRCRWGQRTERAVAEKGFRGCEKQRSVDLFKHLQTILDHPPAKRSRGRKFSESPSRVADPW